jgi:hypothetical protein
LEGWIAEGVLKLRTPRLFSVQLLRHMEKQFRDDISEHSKQLILRSKELIERSREILYVELTNERCAFLGLATPKRRVKRAARSMPRPLT